MAKAATARAKGVAWENEVARFVGGERARVHHPDTGDITGVKATVIEAKNQSKIELALWMDQLQSQVDIADAELGLLAVKRRGKIYAEDGYWFIDPRCVPYIIELVQRAWYLRQHQMKQMRDQRIL